MSKEFTLDEVAQHDQESDAWIAVNGNVYDITDFIEDPTQHPGGITLILEQLGKDVSNIFTSEDVHVHSTEAFRQLDFYKIGTLKE